MADKYQFTTRELAELMHKLHPNEDRYEADAVYKLDLKIQKEFLYVGKERIKDEGCICYGPEKSFYL